MVTFDTVSNILYIGSLNNNAMKLKTIIILYWALNILVSVAVFVQPDKTAKMDAVRWLTFSAFIFMVGVIIESIRRARKNKLKK